MINLQPTKPVDEASSPQSIDPDTNIILDNHSASDVFFARHWVTQLQGPSTQISMTRSFPVTSLENMPSCFIAYDYDTNTIFEKS